SLDVLRALARSPRSLEVFLAEVEQARGADARLDARVEALKRQFSDAGTLETRARRVVEAMALCLQGSLLVRNGAPAVADAFCASRPTAYLVAVASVLSFFASLIMHELGHALVARRNGLPVAGIDLWAFGGMTRSGEPQTPGVEFRVAVAGPLVTLAVIVLCTLAGQLATNSSHFFEAALATGGVRASPALVWLSWVAT